MFVCELVCGFVLCSFVCVDFFFFKEEDGIRGGQVTGGQRCVLPVGGQGEGGGRGGDGGGGGAWGGRGGSSFVSLWRGKGGWGVDGIGVVKYLMWWLKKKKKGKEYGRNRKKNKGNKKKKKRKKKTNKTKK